MGSRAIALLMLAGCGQPASAESSPPARPSIVAKATATLPQSCIESGAPYDRTGFHDRLAVLASVDNNGRAPGSPGDVATRKVIREQLACLQLAPVELPFTAQNGKATANIYARLAGSDPEVGDEIILIAAHHDHLGDGFLGANDNASGIVAMLGVAQDMAKRGARKRTIVFAAFGDEETGMTGSYQFAAHPPADVPIDKIVQVINLDMVGSHSSRGFVAAMGTFKGFAATKLLAKLDDAYPKINVGLGGKARGSDFEPFCKQRIPYVFFWTPDARCYHQKCDTPSRIDEKAMVSIASLAGDLTRAMADSDMDLAAMQQRLGCGVKYED
jgi:hypothetical protein